MNKQTPQVYKDLDTFAEDAQALLTATEHVAEEKVVEARQRLTAALEKGKKAWGQVQRKAGEGARIADDKIREHPYETVGLAFGIGALLGFLLTRRG
jgi:ElaB/YqjD/DUF883 family membrane-anchored ribosome-binding protein